MEQALERVGAGHGLPETCGEPRAEAGAELHEPGEGDLVARVVDESEMGEDILDVPVLEEPQPRADLERDVAAGQLDLEIEGVRVIAVEDGHLLELDALLAQLEDGVRHPGGLKFRGGYDDLRRRLSVVADRVELLLELTLVVLDGGVGEGEDRRRRPVVGLEAEDLAALVALGEAQDVVEVGAAEGVDGLGIVTDDHDVALGSEHGVDDVGLEPVGVLVLVDQDVAVARGEPAPDIGVAFEKEEPVEQQIVEIHEIGIAFALEIAFEDGGDDLRLVVELRRPFEQHVLELAPGVDDIAVDIDEEPRPGQPPIGNLRRDVGERVAHEIAGVLTVENAEPRGVADLLGVAPQDPVAGGVECPAVHPRGVAFEEAPDPVQHLARGLVGEGEEQDLTRWYPVFDEAAGAVDQGPGLAGAGAGEHEHGSAGVHDRRVLLFIEIVGVVHPTTVGEVRPVRRADAITHGRATWPRVERSKLSLRSRP